jgi:ABC-type Fe3+/spermidine/putrescine transport system ATPase subunit
MSHTAVTDIILRLTSISKRFGPTVTADNLSLEVRRGEFFTFLGPSGSGKSTILRMVAGLEQPDSGRIEIDGREVSGVPPWNRNLGMMFQNYAIFPHMTVAENIGYGLKVRGAPVAAREARVSEMLHLVGLAGTEGKNATLLSGGEQQRVTLARALAPEPKMLLLDEPLSALDERLRRAMQAELKRVHAKTGTTFLYVTHDQEEALTMSDRIAVFDHGRCMQCDEPESLYRRPRSTFVARFFRGCNVLEISDFFCTGGSSRFRIAGFEVSAVPLGDRAPVGSHVAVRAEDVAIGPLAVGTACQLSGVLESVTYRGTLLDYVLCLPDGQRLTATTTRRMCLAPGSTIPMGIESQNVILLED